MRILHVNETLGFAGGAEQYLFDVAEGLFQAGHENGLIFQKRDSRYPVRFVTPFKDTFDTNSEKRQGTGHFIKRFNPDVIYIHRWESLDNLDLPVSKTPCVRIFHDQDVLCLRTSKMFYWTDQNCYRPIGLHCLGCLPFSKKAWRKGLLSWPTAVSQQKASLLAHRVFARLVVGSQFMKEQFVKNGISEKQITVLPLFTNFPPKYYDSPHTNTILFVGRLDRGKGLDLLLHALRFVKISFQLIVAGTGKDLAPSQALANRLQLNEHVQFLGGVTDREKLSKLYQQSRLVVIPSRWAEPFGLVGIEAMAHGRPVVAFKSGGLREEILDGVTGYLVEERNIQEFGQKLDYLLKNPTLCIKMGKAGVEHILRYYNKEKHLTELLHIFQQAV
jgi:glycosyltransferase involved in cell wall biosynthesis